MTDKILVERNGPVTTIIINRPKSKNALDNEAAHGLADALQAFEADAEARVAVLTGAGGAFCAGADLKELGSRHRLFPVGRQRRRPVARAAVEAGDRRHRRPCLRGRPGRGAVLRHPHRRRHGRVRRLLAALGRADERRHHRAPAAHRRPGPRARHAADRPRRRRRRGDRHRARHPQGGARHDARRGREARAPRSRASRRSP